MGIIDLIFPKSCLACGRGQNYICGSCLEKVPKIGWHGTNTFSVWKYAGVIRKAVISLKYKYSTEIAKEIATHAVKRLKSSNLEVKDAVLVPIPLYWKRQNLRGFNQSVEIGKLIAKEMNWRFVSDLLLKKKQTKSQVELKGGERMKNLKGVFEVNPAYDPKEIKNKTLIIFDDVYTTGSTLKEAVEILKTNRLKQTYGLTIAR